MKRILLTLSAIILLAGLSGCCCHRLGDLPGCLLGGWRGCSTEAAGCAEPGCESCGEAACDSCGGGGCGSCAQVGCGACGGEGCRACYGQGLVGSGALGGCGIAGGGQQAFTPGPATGAVTYPYYTIRGPRDFLAENPPSIGP